jgi:hypothetical protein
MGPYIVILMSGTVVFESLILGKVASTKIIYVPDRAYQIQSGLATAITAFIVYMFDRGRYADTTIATAVLLFFNLSAANHTATAIIRRNMKPVNLLRPAMALLPIVFLLPAMVKALTQ